MVSYTTSHGQKVIIPQGYGPESESMKCKLLEMVNHIGESAEAYVMPDDIYKANVIKRVLAECSGYATISYIGRRSRVDTCDAERILNANSSFRLSFIRAKNGEPVYLLNTKFALLRDAWKAFRYHKAITS